MVQSIFVNKLLSTAYNYDILNSNKVAQSKNSEEVKHTAETYTLKYKLSDTDEYFPISIEKIVDIEHADVEKFINTFKEMTGLFQWSDEVALIMLNRFISQLVKEQLMSFTTISTKLKHLLNLKYPRSDAIIYSKELNFIIQENFIFINEYHSMIVKTVHKWALCMGICKEEEIRRVEEVFLINTGFY